MNRYTRKEIVTIATKLNIAIKRRTMDQICEDIRTHLQNMQGGGTPYSTIDLNVAGNNVHYDINTLYNILLTEYTKEMDWADPTYNVLYTALQRRNIKRVWHNSMA